MRFVDGQSDLHTRGALPIAGRPREESTVFGAIVANRVNGVAPMGVFLEAGQSGFATTRPRHELRFEWQFPTSGDYAALGGEHPWATAKRTAYGPLAAHVFDTPGTHVVTLRVTDGEQTAVKTVEITVQDPDLLFAGPQTFAISTSGFAGAPAGATQVSSLADARAALGVTGMRNARFLFARGQSHDIGAAAGIFAAGAFDNLQFAAFGAGADPVLTGGGLRTEGDLFAGAVAVRDLVLEGGFDPATGSGSGSAGVGLDLNDAATHCVVNSTVRNYDVGVRSAAGLSNVVLSDCVIEGWSQEGVILDDGDALAVLGCSIVPGDTAQSPHVSGGPGRLEGAAPGRAVLWQNDLHSISDAPCWRWNADGAAGVAGVIGACRMEGGAPVLEVAPSNPGGTDRAGDLVVERCYLLGTDQTGAAGSVKLTHGGTTLRNCIAVLPDVAPSGGVDAPAFITGAAPQTNAANDASPVRIHSNSFVDLRSAVTLVNTSIAFAEVDTGDFAHWTDAEVVNSLVHAPSLQSPVTTHAPFAQSTAFTPRDASIPAGSANQWRPLAKVDATDGSAGGTVALDDFKGTLRDAATPEVGAWEIPGPLKLHDGGTDGILATGVQEGLIRVEVTEPAYYAGTYDVDLSDLADGPLRIRAPEITGDFDVGGTVHATPSLVAWDPTLGRPLQLFEWLRGGVPLDGEIGQSHIVTQADLDEGLFLREQVYNSGSVALDETVELIRATFVEHGVRLPHSTTMWHAPVLTTDPVDKVLVFGSFNFRELSQRVIHCDQFRLWCTGTDFLFRVRDETGANHDFTAPQVVVADDRVNILVTAEHSTGVVRMVYKVNDGPWTTGVDTTASFGGTAFALDHPNTYFYRWAEFVNYRVALFLPASLPDVLASATQGQFAQANGQLTDPIQSQTAYGTGLIDIYGDAATLQSGAHAGTLPSLATQGDFFDV